MPEAEHEEGERGARPLWSGFLSFGLVSVPVDLYPGNRTSRAALRMLDEDGTPLARRFFDSKDEEVKDEHLVLGYELESGDHVVVTDEELERLDPKKSREIDLRLFVDQGELDPIYFERCYFLAPSGESGKAYRLLTAVMEKTKRAGIATFVMRDREYLVAIFADHGVLRAETLRFHDEVRSVAQVGLPKAKKPPAAVVKKIEKALGALEKTKFPLADITDERSRAIEKLAEKKAKKGADVVHGEAPAEHATKGADVIDLMEILKRSLTQGKAHGKPVKATRHSSGHARRKSAKR